MQEVPIVLGFTSGELSPWLDTRFDLQAYQRGARRLENFTVLPYGGIRRRRGTELVWLAQCQETNATRLLPFRYSEEDALMLEFSPGVMRAYRNAAPVRHASGLMLEVAIPWDTPAQINTLRFTQVNDVLFVTSPDHPVVRISRLGDLEWTVETVVPEPFPRATYALREDELKVTFNDDRETVSLELGEDAAPCFLSGMANSPEYLLADAEVPARTLFRNESMNISVMQCPDLSTTSVLWGTRVYVVQASTNHRLYYTCRREFDHTRDYRSGKDSPADYPQHFMQGVMRLHEAQPYEVCGDWELTTHGEWNASWELWRTYDTVGDNPDWLQWEWTTVKTFGQSAYEERKNWALGGSEKTPCRMVLVCLSSAGMPIAAMMSFRIMAGRREYKFRITRVEDQHRAGAVIEKKYIDNPTGFTTRRWSLGAFGVANGYPAFGGYYQNRLWFGGTAGQPTTLFGSCVDDFTNFRMGTDADDALHLTLASDEQSRICWMCATRELLVGTAEGEWSLAASDNGALTATSAAFKRQSAVGSEPLPVQAVENSIIFVQRGGRRLREISYKLESDGFSTVDLSLLAEHLFHSGVAEWCVQRGTDSYIWVLLKDGSLAVLTMNMEQQVTAWQRMKLPGRTPQHIAALPAAGAADDDVWFVTRNNTTGMILIERINSNNGLYVDLAQDITTTSAGEFAGVVTLAGGEICAWRTGYPDELFPATIDKWGDGCVEAPQYPGWQSFSLGRPYCSELQTMPLERDLSFNAYRQFGRVTVRLMDSDCDFMYRGTHAADWERVDTSTVYADIPYTGSLRLTQMPDAAVGQGLVIRYNRLRDFCIQALTVEVDQHGR